MSIWGCLNYMYRYMFNLYRYMLATAGVYRYMFNLYRYMLPTAHFFTRCTGTCSTCTGTCAHFLLGMFRILIFFSHFSSTNPLQYFPYQKSTMESLQNNSKSGLESMKIYFPKVRTFLPKSKSKKMRLGFDLLP